MAVAGVCKLLMIILNLVFLLIGLALLSVGVLLVFVIDVFLQSAFDSAQEDAQSRGYIIVGEASDIKDFPLLHEVGIALLVFGAALVVLSMMGWCGSCCSSCCRTLLLVFSAILIVMMIAEIVVFSLFLVKDSALHKKLKEEVQDKITSDYNEIYGNTFTSTIVILHREVDCCGMEGVQDFGNKQHRSCETANEDVGCYDEMQERLQDNKVYAGLAVAGILALQLLEVICAIVIYKDEYSKIFPI
ncbi:hypothetical protein RRG08_055295 [Elysia crispata]|uniref:Tetraspanin n=1 Tax=Elysia crispata TaxID=231223 RepID=A0AAE0Z269_9GAST|nr:hypothetical protein RRG08_055295 [Elysia crispata]